MGKETNIKDGHIEAGSQGSQGDGQSAGGSKGGGDGSQNNPKKDGDKSKQSSRGGEDENGHGDNLDYPNK